MLPLTCILKTTDHDSVTAVIQTDSRSVLIFFFRFIFQPWSLQTDSLRLTGECLITWCKQHMSALDGEHMEGKEGSHIALLRNTVRHHPCWHWSLEHTLGLCQHRRSLFGLGGWNMRSSGTHDTPRSTQKDNGSARASSALNHVTWQSRQHKAPRDHEDFVWKDTHCRSWPDIQHRTHILSPDCRRYTCRTLDCVEDKDSLLHHLGDSTIHLPLNLRMTNYKLTKVHHSPTKSTHNKFHFLSDWEYNRAKLLLQQTGFTALQLKH